MTEYIPRRADHLYVWRKVRIYQHHGIVISKDDVINNLSSDLIPSNLEDFMIIEQNLHGLNIVTLKTFRTEPLIKYEHDIFRAHYATNLMDYYLHRSGTCYLASRLPEDDIIKNALTLYNNAQQREFWKTYSLFLRNCEQFAFICSTNVNFVLGEQVLMACNVVKCIFVNSMANGVKFIFQLIQDFAQKMLSGTPIGTVIEGSALAALTAFTLEAIILTVRLFIYYYYKETREENLVRQYAITPGDYVQQMIQSGFGSLSAFGLSIAGIFVGSTLFYGSMAPMAFSIFFGFIGYIAARWLTGLLIIKVRKSLSSSAHEKRQLKFINKPGDDNDTIELT